MSDNRLTIPAYDHHIASFTFEDAVGDLLDAFHLESRKKHAVRAARRAVLDAYRDIANVAHWRYWDRRGTIRTVAPQTTGTVQYDHTGGTNERELTLTGATWPSDVLLYGIQIANQTYMVEESISSTVVTLAKNNNPGADIAAGTSYSAFKALYELPTDFRSGSQLIPLAGSSWQPCYADPSDVLWAQFANSTPTEPIYYTIRNGGEQYGAWLLEFGPAPASVYIFDFMYSGRPRPLRYERYADGTISISGTTVTGTDTVFRSDMIGSILRVPPNASNDLLPTGIAGGLDDTDNPYAAERSIVGFTSATEIEINASISEAVSGACFTISDPVDLEPGAMMTAFRRMAEANYSLAQGKKDWKDRRAMAQDAILQAKEAATTYRDTGRPELEERAAYTVSITGAS